MNIILKFEIKATFIVIMKSLHISGPSHVQCLIGRERKSISEAFELGLKEPVGHRALFL